MATVGVVKALITADTAQFQKGMSKATRSLNAFSSKMTKVGKSMTMKVTAPLVGLGFAAGKILDLFRHRAGRHRSLGQRLLLGGARELDQPLSRVLT